ncbi:MAG: hypothetical protein ACREN2_06225 [Candidatus Dormibacteria bacterium]
MTVGAIVGADALTTLPTRLREQLLTAFREIIVNFREGRWEPSELNGGKLCEAVYSVVRGIADGALPSEATKPRNMVDACKRLEDALSAPHSVRVTMPRAIVALYDVRNNRGVGHVGGDVSPNHMDAAYVVYVSKWLMAELVRLVHQLDTAAATAIVDQLVERELPLVWAVAGTRRIMKTDVSRRDGVLLLLYHAQDPVSDVVLMKWMELNHIGNFRRDVLRPEHVVGRLHLDGATHLVHLSPVGVRHVEETLIGPA